MDNPASHPWYWYGVDLFEHTDAAARRAFHDIARRHEVYRGDILFRADDPAQRIYWLEEGLTKIFYLSPLGESVTFWLCVPGDSFGAGAISGADKQSVFAEALDQSVVYSVTREQFEDLVRLHPQFGLNMIKLVSARLRLACDGLTDRITQHTDARVAQVLMRLGRHWGEPQDDGIRFRMHFSHRELGDMVGVCRQTISRTLNDLARQRIVNTRQRPLVITDPCRLSSLAMARLAC